MEVIDNWVAEFFLRRQNNPRVLPNKLLSALQLGDSSDCLKLKLCSVLRDISNSLIRGTIDEGTLDLLEILEKLLLQQQSILMESHKSAYCWTAAECTLRFMWPLSASDGFFTEALERIWTKRIGILKESGSDLVTHDLLKWETDLKKALEDPELYQRIRETNIRYTAISFLTQLLKEQWALLGSSSLESVVQKRFRKRKAEHVEGDNVDNRRDPNAVDESTRRLESDALDNAKKGRGTGEGKDGNGNNSENANDVEGVGCLENDGMDKVYAGDEEHTIGAQEQEHEPGLDKGDKMVARELKNANDVEGLGCVENDRMDKVYAADEEQTIGAQEQEHEPGLDKGDKMVARELKDYLLEIQGHIDPSTSQGKEPNNAINDSIDVTPRPTQMNRTGTGGQDHNKAPQQDNVNEEGSDSQGTWSGRVRPRLPTPVPLNVSPLKKGGLAKPHGRRPKKFWTCEEVEALREGVKEYGKSWKDIKNGNPTVFAERTEVDLKDKWRNLVRG